MKIAKNSKGKLIKILDSVSSEQYFCPVCNEPLTRNFGVEKQYFSHPKDKDNNNCELKASLILKENPTIFNSLESIILNTKYYNKSFDNVKTELSDYMSEEGYYLTQEQKDIIFSKEDRIKIEALAGSAKSSTLYYYAKERPYKKMLYIVYNKAMKDEAEKSFGKLKNVDIKTMHGLAYKYVGAYYKQKLTNNYNAIDVIKDLNLDWNYDQELAVNVHTMLKEYMLSDAQTFEELELFKDEDHKQLSPLIIEQCNKLWNLKKKYNNNIKVEHDFYLKLFQLAKKDLSSTYDIILMDEAQDASKLILDMLINSKVKGIVMVGDKFQALYGWRNAQDIMPLFDGTIYKLTTSFRVSQQTANIANLIVNDCSSNIINMKGFNNKQKIVDKINKKEPYVCLCRTNSYIFAEVIEAIEHNKKALYFEGGYAGYNFDNIKDGYYFSLGHETKNHLFCKFKDYMQMWDYAEKNKDLELLAIIRMIDKYGYKIPDMIDSIKYNITKDKAKADVIFSTIHKSKGQTYKLPVLIAEDHFDIEEFFEKRFILNSDELDLKKIFEEMAITYVAITRAAEKIQLSDILKRYLIKRYKYFDKES